MKNKQVTGPVMVLKNGPQTFQIWILNPGQWCQCTRGGTVSAIWEHFSGIIGKIYKDARIENDNREKK